MLNVPDVIRILKFGEGLGLELKLKVVYLESRQLISAQLGLYNMSFGLGSFLSSVGAEMALLQFPEQLLNQKLLRLLLSVYFIQRSEV